MITVYKTNTMKDACAYVTDIIRKADKRNLSVTHTVIVPDRASMEAERALLAAVEGSFNAQVRTFRRLAADIVPKYDYLSKQAGIMAMTGIVQDNADQLQCYAKSAQATGFAEEIYNTVSMMKYCKISPSQLYKSDLPKGVRAKAHDIALLYQAYSDYTTDKYIDSADKLDLLKESIRTSDAVTNGYFYLYDFDNFSAQELAIIEQLMLRSKGVVVACCVGSNYSDRYLYLNDIYNGVMKVCANNGITPQVIQGNGYTNDFTAQIGEHMFRYDNTAPVETNNVELFCGNDRANEAYALACKIQRYVRSGGRFRDVYVVASDVAKYSNVINVFDELDIPYFCDRQYVLSDHPYARFVSDYLVMVRNNYKLRYVLNFVKNYLYCGFCGNKDDVYRFENYCLKYNVSYSYEKFSLGKTESYFDSADRFRKEFNDFIGKIQIPQAATGKEFVQAILNLLDVSKLDERNAAFAKQQKERTKSENSVEAESQVKVTEQAADKFRQTLAQAEMIVGNRFMKLDDFIKTLSAATASVRISVLPVRNDCVVFANMAKARKHDIKFLALLGVNYGAMPIVKGEGKLLNDKNIKDLQQAGIDVEPQMAVENKRERFSVFQLMQEPTKKLYVSYCLSDGANRLAPSPVVGELSKLFVHNGKPLAPCGIIDEEVYTKKQAVAKVILNKRKMQDNQVVKMPAFVALKKRFDQVTTQYSYSKDGLAVRVDRGAELYLKNSSTSVSQLTDFFKCPYRFFVEYGLNVKPRPVAELKSADLGNILHAVLESYVKQIDKTESDEQTEQKAAAIFNEVMTDDFYKGITKDASMQGALIQLQKESLHMCKVVKKQLANSDFANFACELDFAKDGTVNPVEVIFDGGKFSLVGKIDRVDKLDDKFIVIDYKSGSSAAHYSEKDLYLGHKMQLLVYLKAVIEAYGFVPAGFFYFNIHDEFTPVNSDEAYVYQGRILDDIDIAKALDTTLKTQPKSKTLGIKLKTDGTFSRQGSTLISASQIQNQIDYALQLIVQAGNLMQQGYAAVSPYDGACEYCDYKDICDFGQTFARGERKLSDSVSAETIDSAVFCKEGTDE